MMKSIVTSMVLLGLGAWLVGPAARPAVADEKPAQKADAAKPEAAKASAEKVPPGKAGEWQKRAKHPRPWFGPGPRAWDTWRKGPMPGFGFRPWRGRGPMFGAMGDRGGRFARMPMAGPWHRGAGSWAGPWGRRWGGPGMSRLAFHGGPLMPPPNPEEVFKRLDANGDGAISKDEFMAGWKKRQQRPQEPSPGAQGFGPQGWKPPSASDFISRFGKDGKLTKETVPAPLWERLSKADANQDGAVTKEELEAAHKKMMERFKQRPTEQPK